MSLWNWDFELLKFKNYQFATACLILLVQWTSGIYWSDIETFLIFFKFSYLVIPMADIVLSFFLEMKLLDSFLGNEYI